MHSLTRPTRPRQGVARSRALAARRSVKVALRWNDSRQGVSCRSHQERRETFSSEDLSGVLISYLSHIADPSSQLLEITVNRLEKHKSVPFVHRIAELFCNEY